MLYTGARWFTTFIRTQDINSEVGSSPLPQGVVVSKKEKRGRMALSLTHRVGRIDGFEVCMFLQWSDPIKIQRMNRALKQECR